MRPLSLLRSLKSQYSLLEGSSSPWLKQLLPPPRSNLLTRLFAPSRWSFSGFFRQAAIKHKHQSPILEAYAVDATFTPQPVLVNNQYLRSWLSSKPSDIQAVSSSKGRAKEADANSFSVRYFKLHFRSFERFLHRLSFRTISYFGITNFRLQLKLFKF